MVVNESKWRTEISFCRNFQVLIFALTQHKRKLLKNKKKGKEQRSFWEA